MMCDIRLISTGLTLFELCSSRYAVIEMVNDKMHILSPEKKQAIISSITTKLKWREEVLFAYLFGSFVDPEIPFFRDVDVGVYVDEERMTPKDDLDYAIGLSLSLGMREERFPVDVVVMNRSPLGLAFRITQGVLLFARDEDLWSDYVTRVWALYQDHAITSRHLLEEMVRA